MRSCAAGQLPRFHAWAMNEHENLRLGVLSLDPANPSHIVRFMCHSSYVAPLATESRGGFPCDEPSTQPNASLATQVVNVPLTAASRLRV